MTFSPLQNKLLPAINTISVSEIWLALFPLQKSFVAEHVAHNARFEKRILEYVMAEYDVDLSQPAVPFEKEHILQAILSMPKRTMFESLGLSWNANLVAHNAFRTSRRGPAQLANFSRDEIRFALKFRSTREASLTKLPDKASITHDGLLCFAAWITDVPEGARQLIAYACEAKLLAIPDISAMSASEANARSDLCAHWCEERILLQSTDVVEDIQELEAATA